MHKGVTGRLVAIKRIEGAALSNATDALRILREVAILSRIKHRSEPTKSRTNTNATATSRSPMLQPPFAQVYIYLAASCRA